MRIGADKEHAVPRTKRVEWHCCIVHSSTQRINAHLHLVYSDGQRRSEFESTTLFTAATSLINISGLAAKFYQRTFQLSHSHSNSKAYSLELNFDSAGPMAFSGNLFTTGHSAFQTMNSSNFQSLNNTADVASTNEHDLSTSAAQVESTKTTQTEPASSPNQTKEATEQHTEHEGETTSIPFSPADQQTIAAFMRDVAANRSQTQNVTIVAGVVTKKADNSKEEEAKKKEKKRVMRMSDVMDPNTPAPCGRGGGRCRC